MAKIIFLTGAPGSGKSTIARLLAQNSPKSIHIQVDHLREMMVNGIELPGGDWTDEATRQFQWARSTATFMAELYASQGVDVIIDDVSVPALFPDQYAVLFKNPAVVRFLLLPSSKALIERMSNRAGPHDQFLVSVVPWFYSYLEPMPKEGWIVLDSGEWTIEQTVEQVLKHVGEFS